MKIVALLVVILTGGYFAMSKGLLGGSEDLTNVATNAAQVASDKGKEVVAENLEGVTEQAMEKGKEMIDGATEKVVEEGRQKIGEAVQEVGQNIASPEVGGLEEGVGAASNPSAGSFEDYTPEKIGSNDKVVLDFAAQWCPSCRAFERNVKENAASIPSDVTILKVDYDEQEELVKEYGVKIQHTFVQLDKQGEEVAKWTGSPNLEQFLTKVQ